MMTMMIRLIMMMVEVFSFTKVVQNLLIARDYTDFTKLLMLSQPKCTISKQA